MSQISFSWQIWNWYSRWLNTLVIINQILSECRCNAKQKRLKQKKYIYNMRKISFQPKYSVGYLYNIVLY